MIIQPYFLTNTWVIIHMDSIIKLDYVLAYVSSRQNTVWLSFGEYQLVRTLLIITFRWKYSWLQPILRGPVATFAYFIIYGFRSPVVIFGRFYVMRGPFAAVTTRFGRSWLTENWPKILVVTFEYFSKLFKYSAENSKFWVLAYP